MIASIKLRHLQLLAMTAMVIFVLSQTTGPLAAEEKDPEVIDIGKITVMAPQPGVEITTDKTIIHIDEFKKPGPLPTS